MKDQCWGPGGKSTPSSADRKASESSRPDRHGALAAVRLHADVVAAAVVAGRGDQGEGVVVEGEDRGGGVDVPGLAEERLALVGAGRVDGHDLAARDEPQDVEVVHVAVAEDAAAGRDVGGVRRRLVVGGRPDRVDEPQLTALDGLGQPLVAAVEAALEADVDRDVGAARELGDLDGLGEGSGDRLLAEGGHAGLDTLSQQRRVGGRRSGDDEAVQARSEQACRVRCEPQPQPGGDLPGRLGVGVRDDQLVDDVQALEGLGMKGADPSYAHEPDPHVCRSDHVVVSAVSTPWSRVAGADLAWSCANQRGPPPEVMSTLCSYILTCYPCVFQAGTLRAWSNSWMSA